MLVNFPVSTVQPNTVTGEVWQRNTTFFHSSFVGESCARWLSSRFACAHPDGTAIPVTTVHTCRLLRNVQQTYMYCTRMYSTCMCVCVCTYIMFASVRVLVRVREGAHVCQLVCGVQSLCKAHLAGV